MNWIIVLNEIEKLYLIWVLQLPIAYNQKIWSGAGLKSFCGWLAGFFATHIVQKLLITSLDHWMGFLGLCSMRVKNERWWLMVIRCIFGTNRKLHDFNPFFFRNNAKNDEDANNLSTKTWRLYAPRWKTVSNLNQFCDQRVKLPKPCGISFLALAWVIHCDVEHPVGLVWNWTAYNLQTLTISSKIAIKVSRTFAICLLTKCVECNESNVAHNKTVSLQSSPRNCFGCRDENFSLSEQELPPEFLA